MTRINTNVSSLVAQKSLARSNADLQTALNRLSTGLRINVGKDDPAGLIASEVLRSDIISVQRAITNSERANQLISTADSALGQVSSLLNDIRGLVSEAANTGALSEEQIAANQLQIDSSLEAIDRISQTTSFQGRRLLDGSLGFITTSAGTLDVNATGTFGDDVDTNASGTVGLLTLSAVAAGTAFNDVDVVVVSADAATSVSYPAGTLTITRCAAATADDIATVINAEGTFSATSASAGAVAEGTYTAATSGGLDDNSIVLSATSGGTAFNNVDITITQVSNAATTASYASGVLTITASAGATTADIIAAITAEGTFSASTTGAGLGVYAAGTTADVTSGGSSTANISALQIDQANFGTADSIAVSIDLDTQATQAELTYSGGTLAADLVLEIGGKSGFEVFNFGSGTTVSQIETAINLVSDATGVEAEVVGTGLRLRSTEYGSDAFVNARAISGSFLTLDTDAATATRTEGTDVELRINGVQATGKGLIASLNTSTLDVSFSINADLTAGANVSFDITGGGAIFQLGPDVVSNQQARLGIQGISSATLGGVNGSLFELRSGGAKALATDVKGAAKVVDEVITSVTGLRGRLGAFQKTTLETNIFTLNDTLESLTDAESSIRDADFAAESARLTRAQILVQSGTAVLQIANQNPQNVLALLQ